jgi:hypothetical protein
MPGKWGCNGATSSFYKRSPSADISGRGFATSGPRWSSSSDGGGAKLQSNPETEHDFSKDQEGCAKCGMPRRVWEDTHVPRPGQPYSIRDPQTPALSRSPD